MRKLPLTLLIALSVTTLCAQYESLKQLSKAESWHPEANNSATGAITQWPDRIAFTFEGDKGDVFFAALKKPLDLATWVTDLTFIMGNAGGSGRANVHAVIKDANGDLFYYRLLPGVREFTTGYPVFKAGYRNVPIRLHAFGLKRPDMGSGRHDTIWNANGSRTPPVGPLKLIGLRLEAGTNATETTLSFGDFAWTNLKANESSLYYALDGTEHFGEVDPVPYITLAELGKHYGEVFDVEWELRDTYAGKAILRGQETFHLNEEDPTIPYSLQLEQRIELPVTEVGSYWLHTKLRWAKTESRFPEWIDQKQFRLDIIHSQIAGTPQASDSTLNPAIDFAPERTSYIFSSEESVNIPVHFRPDPNLSSPADNYRIIARNFAGITPIVEVASELDPAAATVVDFDLSGQGPGAWILRAETYRASKLVDAKEILIGKNASHATTSIPESVEVKVSDPTDGESLILLYAQLPDNMRDQAPERWEAIHPFLDQTKEVTDTIEVPIRWKHIEPLPGIIDWTWLDHLLDEAAARRIKVILAPSFVSSEPDWIPGYFKQNAEGGVFGHERYTYYGMRTNLWHAEPLRSAAMRVITQMADRYELHPGHEGYLFLTEQPGDFPYTGWFEGYAPETLADFRQHLEARWQDISALNQRWGSQYADWDAIGVPPEDASQLQQLDWFSFRRNAISEFLLEQVRAIRSTDTDSLIELYGDGIEPRHYPEVRSLNTILANGGASEPELTGLARAAYAPYGIQERAEERSVGRWSAYNPYQLDATLFNMLLGGGGSSHAKMFVRTDEPFENLRQPPYSLDRFEHFIPIWRELRQAAAPQRDVFILNNLSARLMEAQSTTFHSFGKSSITRSFLESQLVAPLVDLPMATSGKLLFLHGDLGQAYEAEVADAIFNYVNGGGTVLMTADAGRTDPASPQEDWVLLRRFGWDAPAGGPQNIHRERVTTTAGSIFSDAGQFFELAGSRWKSAETSGIAATFADGSPAITWKQVGAGKVAVLWASDLVPPADTTGAIRPLADLASWAGASLPRETSHPRLFTNLLQNETTRTHYGLVYHSGSHTPWGQNGPAIKGARTYWTLPSGTYELTELISGQSLGTFTASELQTEGLPCDLKRHAVAVYRMTSQP